MLRHTVASALQTGYRKLKWLLFWGGIVGFIVLLVVGAGLVFGNGGENIVPEKPDTIESEEVPVEGVDGDVRKFTDDNTTCYIYSNGEKQGGISCVEGG